MSAPSGRLMVIASERISEWIDKGEVTDRYFNPGSVFDEVDLVLPNDDRPDPAALQRLVGDARITVHNVPVPSRFFYRTLGWRPALLRSWAARVVAIAGERRPALIRCYGLHLNAFAASEVKRAYGTPFVVSLHGNPDLDLRQHWKGASETELWRTRVQYRALLSIERVVVPAADCIVCVYHFIEPWAYRLGARRVEVMHNVVAPQAIQPKLDYALNDPPRIIAPGRQLDRKDPTPVVEALATIPGLRGTFVGRGPRHESIVARARELGVADRCEFVPAMSNDELVSGLHTYDALISVNDYGGVSKVEIESALTGMPVITNAHPQEERPELLEDDCLVVSGDGPSYADALRRLLGDQALRERMGRALRERAEATVHPSVTEPAYARLYAELAGIAEPVRG
jgi:glycosyltransferase involved in cell wall biosynthesis